MKAEWAMDIFSVLQSQMSLYLERNPYYITHETDPSGQEEQIRIRIKEHIPLHWALLVGDLIHNLRASLDLLATDLARANGVTSRTGLSNTYFPISSNKDEFEKNGKKRINHLSEEDRKKVARIRPYRGGNDCLWELHRIDILGKHIILVPTVCALIDSIPEIWMPLTPRINTTQSAEMKIHFTKKLHVRDGDIIASYPKAQRNAIVTVHPRFDVVFGAGQVVDGQPVLSKIEGFIQEVNNVLNNWST